MTDKEKKSAKNRRYYERHCKKPDGIFLDQRTGRVWEHNGYSKRINWSRQMLDDLRSMYPNTFNYELAHILGVSSRTMIRKARELGLKKDREWLRGVYRENMKVAHILNKVHGNKGQFKKGVRSSPETEFKSGRRKPLTDEQESKRRESLKRSWCLRRAKERRKKNEAVAAI